MTEPNDPSSRSAGDDGLSEQINRLHKYEQENDTTLVSLAAIGINEDGDVAHHFEPQTPADGAALIHQLRMFADIMEEESRTTGDELSPGLGFQ